MAIGVGMVLIEPDIEPPPTRSRIKRRLEALVGTNSTAFVLGAIIMAAAFDILALSLAIEIGRLAGPLHFMTAISLLVVLALVIFGYQIWKQFRAMASPDDAPGFTELRKSKELAEAANLAKARYLANVSHEIRSPLNAIYGYAQLIEQEADVRPQDAARIIRRCAEHMASLVESLLDLSRMENGVLRIRNETFRLTDFVDQIVWMMRPAAQAKGLNFILEVPASLPEFVRTDQNRFRQVLINLLSNAIKFTDCGSVTFRVSHRGETASFEIIDTGPGIAPEDQVRIFDPYERGVSKPQPDVTGVGLGLPISKAIVEMLGGKIELESAPDQGSIFRIKLMLGEVANMRIPAAAQRRICGYEGPPRSVLIVDDEPDQRSFLETFLQACGLQTTSAANGETAIRLCATRAFDLAILDISLPGMSGWETAVELRQRSPIELFIIMASANAQEFHHPVHNQPVHDHFFIKPYKLDEMAETIGALLKLSWKWEVTGSHATNGHPEGIIPAAATVHVERLLEMIRIGHVRGIEAEIRELATRAPNAGRLVSALYSALDEFDLTGMARLLEDV